AHGAEPVFDRWGHAQHHTHTYFPQLDPESIGPRPVKLSNFFLPFIGIGIIKPFPIIKHALGIIDDYTKELVPGTDWKKMIWSSRLWLLGYVLIITASLYYHSILPLVYTLFARFYGAFIPTMLNQTQHVGLEQDVYDHRLITRNVKLNPVLSFIYWNMEHHIEHHMFPGVPFYALSKLNVLLKDQLPAPYNNIWTAYKEIIPTILRQQKDSGFHITPILPEDYKDDSKKGDHKEKTKSDNKDTSNVVIEGSTKWIPALEADNLSMNDIAPFKYEDINYAIYRLEDGYYASSGKCTHAGALLAKGLVIDERIECPAHQGRFDIRSGKATHSPASDYLVTYPTRVQDGLVFIGLSKK
ncbi:MAG: fatty acid desaturase, partial [Spirochaetales bacterium]|nr:fatty acid desaturase [Spirochaetales bacterium]